MHSGPMIKAYGLFILICQQPTNPLIQMMSPHLVIVFPNMENNKELLARVYDVEPNFLTLQGLV